MQCEFLTLFSWKSFHLTRSLRVPTLEASLSMEIIDVVIQVSTMDGGMFNCSSKFAIAVISIRRFVRIVEPINTIFGSMLISLTHKTTVITELEAN